MADSVSSPATHLIILARARLQHAAWEALLAGLPGLTLSGAATSPDHLRSLPPTDGPTAVLLDLDQPSSPEIARLAQAAPEYGLLCLVDGYELDQIVALLQAGAAGALSRDATVAELVRAIVAAGRGEIVLPPALAARALAALARGELRPQRNAKSLTDREREVLALLAQGLVLALLAQGLTNKDIAQSLFLSVRTIEAHLRNIYDKLDVTSRTEAVLWAVQQGVEA